MVKKNVINNIDYFLENEYIPQNLDISDINFEMGFFMALDEWYYVYESLEIEAQSLIEGRESSEKYFKDTLEILEKYNSIENVSNKKIDIYTDKEILYNIKEELGQPPNICKPIYIITVEESEIERVVYIGKTNSTRKRFVGGHTAITKLHNSVYEGTIKRIYLGDIMFLSDENEYIPMEFLSKEEESNNLILQIEAALIHNLKPELNTQQINKKNFSINSQIFIQNFVGSILNQKTIEI